MTDTLREIRLDAAARALDLVWSDGRRSALPYRVLRERCRCAECRRTRQTGASIFSSVSVVDVVPCGPNAVQLVFSDGHDLGIFPFGFLRILAESADEKTGTAVD